MAETKDILEAELAALTRKLFGGPDALFAKLPSDQMARLRGQAAIAQRHYAEAGIAQALAEAHAQRAIQFARSIADHWDRYEFLEAFAKADLGEWPEFVAGAARASEESGADA